MDSRKGLAQVTCPFCGYRMPIKKEPDAVSRGIWVKCKGRNCGKEFEIKLPKDNTDK